MKWILLAVCAGILAVSSGSYARIKAPPSDAVSSQPDLDADGDGLTNQEEAERGTSANNRNTDGDAEEDLNDAIGYSDFFTFRAAPETHYVVLDLGPKGNGEVHSINNAGSVLVKTTNGWELLRPGQASFQGAGEPWFLDGQDRVLHTSGDSPARLEWQGATGNATVLDFGNELEGRFGKTEEPYIDDHGDGTITTYGMYVYPSVSVLGVFPDGTLALGKWGSLLYLIEHWQGGTWISNEFPINAIGYYETFGNEERVQSSRTFFNTYFGGGFSGKQGIYKLADIWSGQVIAPEPGTWEPASETRFITPAGDWASLTSELAYADWCNQGSAQIWKFSDNSTVSLEAEVQGDLNEDIITLGRLPGQDGLWKYWFRLSDSKRSLSLGPFSAGRPIFEKKGGRELQAATISPSGQMLAGNGLWRNGRVLSLQKMGVDKQAYSQVFFRSMSPNGDIIAAIGKKTAIQEWRHISLVPCDITFEKVGENAEIEDNKFPTGWDANGNPNKWEWMPGKGKRIFPDAKAPNDAMARNEVYVKVTGPPEGWKVQLKVFDVDDPTLPTKDPDNIVDANDQGGEKGGDNLGTAAVFTSGNTTQVDCTIEGGAAKISGDLPKLKVGMQPGDNYRVAVILLTPDGMPFDGQSMNGQVTDKAGTGYIPSGGEPASGFSGIVSPMLTVWRKLNLEIDSMPGPPNPKGAPDQATVTGDHWALDSENRLQLWIQVNDQSPAADFYVNGTISNGSQTLNIVDSTEFRVTVSGNLTMQQQQAFFTSLTLKDDDDKYLAQIGLQSPPLPRNADHAETIKQIQRKYAPAYVQIDDANAKGWNTNQTISFQLNQGAASFNWDDARDLPSSTDKFWTWLVVFGYQPSTSQDNDPDLVDSNLLGGTPMTPLQLNARWGYSVIYLEGIREQTFESLLLDLGNPVYAASYVKLYRDWLFGIVAHEMGHGPSNQSEQDDHNEGGLMRDEGAPISGPGNDFTPPTIKRFRERPQW